MASFRISLPSASVFSTSMVFPESDFTMSPGRCARPLSIFSTEGTKAVTATGGFNCAMARMAPNTAAAPHISYFIFSMPSAGEDEIRYVRRGGGVGRHARHRAVETAGGGDRFCPLGGKYAERARAAAGRHREIAFGKDH